MSNHFEIQVIGHAWAVQLLQQQYAVGRVAQALLLTGPPQVGKSTLARFFAQSLVCAAESKPCGQCGACRKFATGNHPDIQVFDADNDALKIDQIRDVQKYVTLSPYESQYRVVVLCNFERATTSAANALLKTLEEPPSYAVLILTATDPSHLLPTIVSRCQRLSLRPLPRDTILAALQRITSPEQAELLTQLSGGRLGWALTALGDEAFMARRTQHIETWRDLLRMSRADRLAYAHSIGRDVDTIREVLPLWLSLWRDLMLLNSGGTTPITNLDWHETLARLAQSLQLAQIQAAMLRLRQALTNMDSHVNPRLNLEVVLLKLPIVK